MPFSPGNASSSGSSNHVADECRVQGNDHFNNGRFKEAIASYTRAIQYDNQQSKLFTNRALCHLKLGDLAACETDALRAAELDRDNSKAFYLKGRCHLAKGSFRSAVGSFQRGMELCCLVDDTQLSSALYSDLFNAYFVARRCHYESQRTHRVASARQSVEECKAVIVAGAGNVPQHRVNASLSVLEQLYCIAVEDSYPDHENGSPAGSPQSPAPRGGNDDGMGVARPLEIPECFLCPISLEVMRDPVILNNPKSGFMTFDRISLNQHFAVRGPTDPITQEWLAGDLKVILIPNVSMRTAIHTYLEAHPWLYAGEV